MNMPPLFQIPVSHPPLPTPKASLPADRPRQTTINLPHAATVTRDNGDTVVATRPHVTANRHSQSPPRPLAIRSKAGPGSSSSPVRHDSATFESPVSEKTCALERAARRRWVRESDRVLGKGAARLEREARGGQEALEKKKARAAERRKEQAAERARDCEEEAKKTEAKRVFEEKWAREEARVKRVRAMRRARAREPERLRRVAERMEWRGRGADYTPMVPFQGRVASGLLG